MGDTEKRLETELEADTEQEGDRLNRLSARLAALKHRLTTFERSTKQ